MPEIVPIDPVFNPTEGMYHPSPAIEIRGLYDTDFHAWTQEQTQLLTIGDWDHLDVEHQSPILGASKIPCYELLP
jgi:Domain of unknown function DUF29